MPEPNRQISTDRKVMYYGGTALVVVGFLLFLSNFCILPMQVGSDDFGPGMHASAFMGGMAFRAVGGMMLMIAGSMLARIGARGWAGSGAILDPQRARRDLEPFARMGGGMVNDALEEAPAVRGLFARPEPQVVKVRCRNCQALNDETDKFCGQCGQAM